MLLCFFYIIGENIIEKTPFEFFLSPSAIIYLKEISFLLFLIFKKEIETTDKENISKSWILVQYIWIKLKVYQSWL